MKDYITFPPIKIQSAQGCYLYTSDGKRILDAVSSWWCKSLGHQHPVLKKALREQLDAFEHVMMANTTYDALEALSDQLVSMMPHTEHVFYAGDGSCAVEVAMKMSIHMREIAGSNRSHFIALKNGYHGETCATLSVSDLGLYKDPYRSLLMDATYIDPIAYISGEADPLWHDASSIWPLIERQLEPYKDSASAFIFEPILQGAGGMLIYSPDCLKRIAHWCQQHDIHLIADEIMTGFARTGSMLACSNVGIKPDFICLSKGLTAGHLPMSAVLTTAEVYDTFYADYHEGRSFLHSHTYCGHALAAAVACAVFKVYEEEGILDHVRQLQPKLRQSMQLISKQTGALENIRGVGGVVAADLKNVNSGERLGYQIFQKAVEYGVWLRPLGNTIYWCPPLNIQDQALSELTQATIKAIQYFYR